MIDNGVLHPLDFFLFMHIFFDRLPVFANLRAALPAMGRQECRALFHVTKPDAVFLSAHG
jgi:hypothetical protein